MEFYKMTNEQKKSLEEYVAANLVCKVGNPILSLLQGLEFVKDEPVIQEDAE